MYSRHLLHHFERELAALPGLLNLLVGELFQTDIDQIVVVQTPGLHDGIDSLYAMITFVLFHIQIADSK